MTKEINQSIFQFTSKRSDFLKTKQNNAFFLEQSKQKIISICSKKQKSQLVSLSKAGFGVIHRAYFQESEKL